MDVENFSFELFGHNLPKRNLNAVSEQEVVFATESQSAKEEFKQNKTKNNNFTYLCHNLPKRNLNELRSVNVEAFSGGSQSAKEEFKPNRCFKYVSMLSCHNLPKRNLNEFWFFSGERNVVGHNLPKRNLNSVEPGVSLHRFLVTICQRGI